MHKDTIYAADHDAFIKHSCVWKYAKKFLNMSNNILPSFSKEVWTTYSEKKFEENQAKCVFQNIFNQH